MLSITGKRKGKKTPLVYAPLDIDKVIGNSFRHKDKSLYTNCEIVAHLGGQCARLKENYYWNGADIPRLFWTILRINPRDIRSAIASGFHDEGCENPNTPQVMADSLFVSLLGPIRFNGYPLEGVGKWRARFMYWGVRAYSLVWRPVVRWFK